MKQNKLLTLWKTLTQPVSVHPDEARREYMTRVVSLITALVAALLAVGFFIGLVSGSLPLDSLLISAGMSVLFVASWVLTYRGYWRVAGMIPPLLLFSSAVYGNLIGGAGAPAMVLYADAILLTALLQGERAHWITWALSLIFYLGIYTAQVNGILVPSRSVESAYWNRVVISFGAYTTLAALIWFLTSQYKIALFESNNYAREVSETNRLLEEEIAERERVEQEIRQGAKTTQELNMLVVELASAAWDANLFEIIATHLKRFTNALGVSFSEYDPEQRCLIVRHIAVQEELLRQVEKIAKVNLIGMHIPLSCEDMQRILDNVVLTSTNIADVFYGMLPKEALQTIQSLFNIAEVTVFFFRHGDELLGSAVVALPQGQPSLDTNILRIYANVASVALQRKKAESALRASEVLYRSLVETSPDGIAVSDLEGRIITCNQRTAEMWGFACCEDLKGVLALELVAAEDRSRAQNNMQRILENETLYGVEYTLLRKDGSRFIGELSARLIADAHGDPVSFVVIARDITIRKQAEEEIRQRNQELGSIGNLIGNIATNLNISEILDMALKGALEITGLEGGTLCLTNPEHNTLVLSAFRNASEEMVAELGAEEVQVGDCLCGYVAQTAKPLILWDNASGSEFATYEAVRNEGIQFHAAFPIVIKEKVIGILCIFSRSEVRPTQRSLDVVERLCGSIGLAIENARLYEQTQRYAGELETHVRQRTNQLEAANRELEAFSYSVSHDLRAPLRGIDGFSQALVEDYWDKLDEQGQHNLQRVRTAVRRMSNLIEDLLQLSRISKSQMRHTRVDLSSVAARIVQDLRQQTPLRTVEVVIAEGVQAQADEHLIQIALENLLGNAWKFTTRQERARIEFGIAGQKEGSPIYFVRDNGAGVDMAYADKLFGAFQRLHNEKEFPGTGIGLATVQRIIHRHGGQVWAESGVGQGATFFFTIPT